MGTIIVDHALIPLLFFFVFTITYCFFTGKLPMIRLETTWNSPHKGMPGMITMIMPLFLSFFVFLTTYLVFTGKLPMIGLWMTGNGPHKGMLGTIITIVPYIFFFFLFKYLLFIYRKTAHIQAHDAIPTKVCRARS